MRILTCNVFYGGLKPKAGESREGILCFLNGKVFSPCWRRLQGKAFEKAAPPRNSLGTLRHEEGGGWPSLSYLPAPSSPCTRSHLHPMGDQEKIPKKPEPASHEQVWNSVVLPDDYPLPPFPACEQERLAALRACRILDTPAEAEFDRIAVLAARVFHAETAYISSVPFLVVHLAQAPPHCALLELPSSSPANLPPPLYIENNSKTQRPCPMNCSDRP